MDETKSPIAAHELNANRIFVPTNTDGPNGVEELLIDSESLPTGIMPSDIIGCGSSSLVAICPRSGRVLKFSHASRKYALNVGSIALEYTIYKHLQEPDYNELLIYCHEYIPPTIPGGPEILILDYAINGSLRDLLNHSPYSSTPTSSRFKWAIQAATALQFVHSKGVFHGDVKGTNLLLDVNNNIKLADFSCAMIAGSKLPSGFVVPVTPYEVTHRLPDRKLSIDTDIFAFGMTLYEIFMWKEPYEELFMSDQSHLQIIHDLYLKKVFPNIDGAGQVGNVILTCWNLGYTRISDAKRDLETIQAVQVASN